jgi:hypothetical protein
MNKHNEFSKRGDLNHLLARAKQLVGTAGDVREVTKLMPQLIAFYEMSWEDCSSRWLAAEAVASLARYCPKAVGPVLESARHYAIVMQEIGDANPYSPNSFEVLARGPNCELVCSFLREAIKKYPGMADRHMHEALATMGVRV